MGDVGSALATPFTAVGAVVTGQANKKIYYDCPRCGKEVWVYATAAAFVNSKCVNCRGKSGPLDLGIVGDAVDVAITPITAIGATITGNANEKIWYDCPKCGEKRWVSALTPHYEGRICLTCKPMDRRVVQSTVPLGSLNSINKIEKDKAKSHGSLVYQQWGVRSDKNYSSKVDLKDKIVSIKTYCCRILHGSVSWLANAAVQVSTLGQADLIDHWWTVIKTKNGYYYQLQFRGLGKLFNDDGVIALRKCSSLYECNQTGLWEADKEPDATVFKNDDYCYTYSDPAYTIGDVVKWMKSHEFSAKYSVTKHNCQDMCKAFYEKF